jgi:hypothetical protein
MPDSEKIDDLLRRSLASSSLPSLSPDFEQRLAGHLRPRDVGARGRILLRGYGVLAFLASVGAMRASGMQWWLAALCLLASLALAIFLAQRFFPGIPKPR